MAKLKLTAAVCLVGSLVASAPPVPAAYAAVPTLSSISPSSTTAGGGAFTLTANGTNFTSSSVVRWNGSNRTTTFVSSTRLRAAITAADIAGAGTASVTVRTGGNKGGTSAARTYTINA